MEKKIVKNVKKYLPCGARKQGRLVILRKTGAGPGEDYRILKSSEWYKSRGYIILENSSLDSVMHLFLPEGGVK